MLVKQVNQLPVAAFNLFRQLPPRMSFARTNVLIVQAANVETLGKASYTFGLWDVDSEVQRKGDDLIAVRSPDAIVLAATTEVRGQDE